LLGFLFDFVGTVDGKSTDIKGIDNEMMINSICQDMIKPIMGVKTKGLAWVVPSSAGWCKGRSASRPFGDLSGEKFCVANTQAAIITICLVLCWLRGIFFVLEHPSASWMARVGPLEEFLIHIGKHNPITVTNLAAFGCTTSRPRKLWGTWRTATTLWRQHKPSGRSAGDNREEVERPDGLGVAVAKAFKAEAGKMRCGRLEADMHFDDIVIRVDALIAKLPVGWGPSNNLMDIVHKICTGYTEPVKRPLELEETEVEPEENFALVAWTMPAPPPSTSARPDQTHAKHGGQTRIPHRYRSSIKYLIKAWEDVMMDTPDFNGRKSMCDIKLKSNDLWMHSIVCCYDYQHGHISPHPDIIMNYFNAPMLDAMTIESREVELDIAIYSVLIQCPWTVQQYASVTNNDEEWDLMMSHWPIKLLEYVEARQHACDRCSQLADAQLSSAQSTVQASIQSRLVRVAPAIIEIE
jgi:hypothetical protein